MASRLDLSVDRGTDVPLGVQLAGRIRAALQDGTLAAGDRLPSVRKLAEEAGVNVNTVRAVYARLESERLLRSEQGRGTFAAGEPSDAAATRRELHRQIAQLEAALVRLPQSAVATEDRRPKRAAALLSAEDLEAVRDDLRDRLRELDLQRAAVRRRLDQLEVEPRESATPVRRATPSLSGARIRWSGA
jgi:DNA-binding transcriptional regulator YhcF (GntR family)